MRRNRKWIEKRIAIIISRKIFLTIVRIMLRHYMQLKMHSNLTLNVISVYAPQSYREEEYKHIFYKQLNKTYNTLKNKGPTLIIGDFNARPGAPQIFSITKSIPILWHNRSRPVVTLIF